MYLGYIMLNFYLSFKIKIRQYTDIRLFSRASEINSSED